MKPLSPLPTAPGSPAPESEESTASRAAGGKRRLKLLPVEHAEVPLQVAPRRRQDVPTPEPSVPLQEANLEVAGGEDAQSAKEAPQVLATSQSTASPSAKNPPPGNLGASRELKAIFGPGGVLSRALGESGRDFEARPEQLEMALAVQKAIDERAHLLIEAGTGVGKSYAYLLPFILWAVRAKKKVLIATHTKALQQQLVERDLPFLHSVLQEHLDMGFRWSLCLGTANYLCPRRLAKAEVGGLFATKSDVAELHEIRSWAGETPSGRNIDLPFEPSSSLWSQVNRESDLCMGRACPLYEDSFYYMARREAEKAHVLIANHHLLFAHLATGGNTAGAVLPPFDALVIDEAHTAEDVASSYLGLEITNLGLARLLETLHHRRSGRTILAGAEFKTRDALERELVDAVEEARGSTGVFFGNLQMELNLDASRSQTLRIRKPLGVENALDEPLARVQRVIADARRAAESASDETLMRELDGFASRCDSTRTALKELLLQARPEHVYWAAMQPRPSDRGSARVPRLSLHGAPIEIAESMRKTVFGPIRPVVMTSATMTTGSSFEFLCSRLGLDLDDSVQEAPAEVASGEKTRGEERAPVHTLSLGSPFDYETNALIYLARDLPDPTQVQPFEEAAIRRAALVVEATQGRAFVLCTSFRMVDAAAKYLRETLPPSIRVLAQGEGARNTILETFRRDTSSVLVGTTSFWQGVDVPGESLSCVVLMKLPFAVPDDPIVQARVEKLREARRNPFNEYQVPQAVMMFRQGFGRLIRTKSDRGIVAILDPRVVTRPYGRTFLLSLPPCRQTESLEDIQEFCR
jgi:ATP-dependent DNA helicase DinG